MLNSIVLLLSSALEILRLRLRLGPTITIVNYAVKEKCVSV